MTDTTVMPAAQEDRLESTTPFLRRIAARTRTGIIVLDLREVWAFEARDRLCFVHTRHGRYDVDVSLLVLESELGAGFVRVHRGWLVNLSNVRQLERRRGELCVVVGSGPLGRTSVRAPVSREHAVPLRRRLLEGTVGCRKSRGA